MKDFKVEFDVKQFASQTDLTDQLNQFNSKIAMINDQIKQMPNFKADVSNLNEQLENQNYRTDQVELDVQQLREQMQSLEN